MSANFRLGVVVALAVVASMFTETRVATAQRIVIGGGNQNRDRDEDEDRDDDDEDNQNQNKQNQGNRSSRNSSKEEQIQQFLQGRQNRNNQGQFQNNNNNNNNNNNQQRRTNQQGQFQGQFQNGQFQNGQLQGGQFQGGQFQQFRPQNNQQNLRFGTWQGNQWQGSRDVENWATVFGGGKKPFSKEWYQNHPKAWNHQGHHDHDDVWVVATLPGVYSWLNWGNAPGVRVGVQPDLSRFHDFYPLGVYSLMSGPGDMGTRVVQLAIDRHGHIAGNYYDMITDTNSSLSGEVRRDSQRVSWSLNKNPAIRFRASLNRLFQPYGTVVVQMPGGEQDWQFVRLEN